MKNIPILMSTMMMQALIAGTKTETRRGNGLAKVNERPDIWDIFSGPVEVDGKTQVVFTKNGMNGPFLIAKCPYGNVKDILWCRETIRKFFTEESGWDEPIVEYAASNCEPMPMHDGDGFQMFKADGSERFIPWTPAIHMPKDYCRKWLEITSIGIERVQDITHEDAMAEGVDYWNVDAERFEGGEFVADFKNYNWVDDEKHPDYFFPTLNNAIDSYKSLWIKINGPGSWDANPWVWVIKFREVPMPENFLK